jgi:glycosyltransferase involved in cell wall biosynthesis
MHAPTIHLVCPLSNAFGRSEQRTADYLALLAPHADVTLWAEEKPHDTLAGHPSRRLDPASGSLPEGGTLGPGRYFHRARPLARAYAAGAPDHRVQHAHAPASGRFTVGRSSRDEQYKHHPQDIRLYRHLADRGMRVRLMGASVLRERLGNRESIEVLDAGVIGAPGFLQSLDAFIYRTDPIWSEPSGRVVVEGMACELPVVVGRNGGYRELIDHGTNGFLFDTHVEAVEYLDALRSDPALARRVGRAARSTVVGRFGHSHIARVREFFPQATAPPEDDSRRS